VPDVTQILEAIDAGDSEAAEKLLPLVYEELRRLASQKIRQEKPGQTLQATALVHEAYLRLVGKEDPGWDNRGHFFAAAAEAMRRVLIDRARSRGAVKRGGDAQRLLMDPALLLSDEVPAELLDLDEALSRLAETDAEKAQLVKLRFFTGLTLEEAAQAMGISESTAKRYWRFARASLYQSLSEK
jgi:RNA polymerase sigma factor (TIGR02999 family)